MSLTVTAEQIRGLAPDEPSIKAARSLAVPRPWSSLGQNGRLIWGACQGSGKDPYLTQVDWEGPAFKCSCPSRKFPCKHGLALLLLLAEQPQLFATPSDQPPDWVQAWLASRQKRAETKTAKEPAPVDEAARAERVAQRTNRIAAGLDLLDLWLKDLVAQGLASAPSRGFAFWDQQAARLVDAQAPGIARRVREMAGIVTSGEGWQARMLSAVARLVLLIRAFQRLDQLSAETQADVRAAIGLPIAQNDVLAREPVRDCWLVSGQRTEQEDRLRVQRTWLLGKRTGHPALLLDFAVGTSGFQNTMLPGTAVEAELCFFPSASPLRALLKQSLGTPEPASLLNGAVTITEAYQTIGARLALNPWLERQPAALLSVTPVPASSQWLLVDAKGTAMPCAADYPLLAFSSGRPINIFGEWDGEQLHTLMAQSDDRFIATTPKVAAA